MTGEGDPDRGGARLGPAGGPGTGGPGTGGRGAASRTARGTADGPGTVPDESRLAPPAPDPLRVAFLRFVGLLIVTVAIAILAWRFVAIDATSHSASDTLRPWLLQAGLVAAAAALALVLVERGIGPRRRRG